jgi:2-oxoisovalerate dehydrogenase E1 component
VAANDLLPEDLDPLERDLLTRIGGLIPGHRDHLDVDALAAATLLEAEITSRLVDHTARWLRAEHGIGYYTIGSAGHEANAAVALALRPTDPALLHYRSGGFYMARSMQAAASGVAVSDPVTDVVRGMLARSTEPIAGGRHKVFGNHQLAIIPQTSTIASHLPRAVGLALSFSLAEGVPTSWPEDSVVVCSFGDASLNHSTAQGALNWAGHAAHRGERVPIIFVCEDNGLGLSVPSPEQWVSTSTAHRTAIDYIRVDGSDPAEVLGNVGALVAEARQTGRPGFVHLDTVRFLGHAGTDVESAYRTPAELQVDRERDPIIGAAQLAIDLGVCSSTECTEWYLDLRSSIRAIALELRNEPELTSADEVMSPLTALASTAPAAAPMPTTSAPPASDPAPLTLAQTINQALSDQLQSSPDVLMFGEDVGRKGGVYGVTRGLQKRFGSERVFDTLLDEQSILGLALGSAVNGRLPIPEIQYLAYFHNAEDQLRGEAATLAYFSQGQYRNPMVVRIASYGYQKGFGGHFHNDNSIAVLRDVPGVVIASPSHPSDAAGMLHSCIDHARRTGAVCVYLEPIARYHDTALITDANGDGDGQWLAPYDPTPIPIGSARVWPTENDRPDDLTIITWGNGAYLSRQAQHTLSAEHGVRAKVLDLRWIAPLPVEDMLNAARSTGRVLIVDETRRTGGVGEGLVAELLDAGFRGEMKRVAARDSFIPLGAAASLVLVSAQDIVDSALALVR